VIKQIETEAAAYAAAIENLEKVEERYAAINELAETLGDEAIDTIEGLVDGTKTWNDVLADTTKLLQQMLLKALLLGEGPLANLFGTSGTGGNVGGLIGSLVKRLPIGGGMGAGEAAGLAIAGVPRLASSAAAVAPRVVVEVASGELFEAHVASVSGAVAAVAIKSNNATLPARIRESSRNRLLTA
jgi:hypothetical protein